MSRTQLISYRIVRREVLIALYIASNRSVENSINYANITRKYRIHSDLKLALYMDFKQEGLIEVEEEISQIRVTKLAFSLVKELYNPIRFSEENKLYALHLIYRLSHGSSYQVLPQSNLWNCMKEFSGMSTDFIMDALEELRSEDSIKWDDDGYISITKDGISKVEGSDFFEAILRMENNEFLPRVKKNDVALSQQIHNYNGNIGAVMHGDHNQSTVNQKIGNSNEETLSLISQLREVFRELPDAVEHIDVLEEEVKSPTPNSKILKTAIFALSASAQQLASKLTDGSADILIQALKRHLLGNS